ncbi:MAG: DNA-directed RNA polymerase subunit omega [Clostridia bacterium]|nr:DNA-directed RNA polymerase subunit omega [Clostridia bacterium]
MIVEPSITELLELVEDRYELIILASKRARQIASGAPKLVNTDDKSPVTVAAEEILEGKVKKV